MYRLKKDELYHYGVKGMKWREHKYLARTGPNGEFIYSYNKKDQPQTAEDKRNQTKLEGYTNVLTRTVMNAASKTAKSTKKIVKPEPKTLKEAEKRVKEGIKKSKEKRKEQEKIEKKQKKAAAKVEKARKKKIKALKKNLKSTVKNIYSNTSKALKNNEKISTYAELAKHERAQKKKKRIEESKKNPTQGITISDYSNETASNRPHSRKRHDSGKSAYVQLGKRRRSVKQQKKYEDSIRQVIEENRKEVTLRNGNSSDTGIRKKKRPHSRRRINSGKSTYVVKRKMY